MKKLKHSCPFGGKQYPQYLLMASPFIVMLLTSTFQFSAALTLAAFILLPLIILIVCLAIEQSLSPEEKMLIEAADLPLWQPADPQIIASIRMNEESKGSPVLGGLLGGVVFCAAILVTIGFNTVTVLLCGAIIIAIVILLVSDLLGSSAWAEIDETAVYTDIAVDHMYDVKRRRTRGPRHARYTEEWYESYIVFYLPDGRYILHCRDIFQQHPPVIRVIQFRGKIRWFAL